MAVRKPLVLNGGELQQPQSGDSLDISVSTGQTILLGAKARMVVLSNGVAIEVQNGTGTWVEQVRWTET